jgi:[acyl-carrier-protein] S-malonyltransferase
MINQITSPVLFYPMIKTMIEDGYTHFIELGPRATLSSFIRKTDKRVFVLADVETQGLDMFLNTLRSELHE